MLCSYDWQNAEKLPRESFDTLRTNGERIKGVKILLLVQPIVVFELSRQVGLGQVLKVLVGKRIELVLETG